MNGDRFLMPAPGAPVAVRFPRMATGALSNGLRVRVIAEPAMPLFTATLVMPRGTSADPSGAPGLASLTGDLVDEGAGPRDAIELADAFARLGAQWDIDVGPDATWLSVTALGRHLTPALRLLADVVCRPRLEESDFLRVRDLRVSRLRQLSRSAGTIADRVFVSEVFSQHPYGHGSLGTTASLSSMRVDDARAFWMAHYRPQESTLLVSGSPGLDEVRTAADEAFAGWSAGGDTAPADLAAVPARHPGIWLVDRPGSAQSEVRIGHAGPPRRTPAYHALIALNALLGGQFTSRINRRLRQEKGITYGARTSFDFRRSAGTFSCDSSVQADATAAAVADVLAELADIRRPGSVSAEELGHAQASLTRGYVRHFETTGQLARAAAQLVTYSLADDTFDRFVPDIEHITTADIQRAAVEFLHPDEATVVVVGEAAVCQRELEELGWPVTVTTVEF